MPTRKRHLALGPRVARDSDAVPLRKYMAAYAAVVVLMWAGNAGLFHGDDDDREYVQPTGPLHLESAERLLSNILIYSAGAFVGIAAGERRRRARLISPLT
jgi:hypothetical protein